MAEAVSRGCRRVQRGSRPSRPLDPDAALARRILSGRSRRHQLSPLLQHQRARRPAHGAAGAVRPSPTAWCSGCWPTARSTACASIISTGCSIPRSIACACAQKAERPFYLVVEKILARARAPARGLAGRRHDGLRIRQPGRSACSSILPAKQASPDLYRRFHAAAMSTFADDRARLQDPHHGGRDGERVEYARPRRRAHRPLEQAHVRLHQQHPARARSRRSSPAFPSTAPMSTDRSRRRRTAAISIGRSPRPAAPRTRADQSVFDFLHDLLTTRSRRRAEERVQPARGGPARHEGAAI